MTKLYLDIDDTILDTEKYIRDMLDSKGIDCSESVSAYVYREIMPEVENIFTSNNYNRVPYKLGAFKGVLNLCKSYDIVLISNCTTEDEERSKREIADRLSVDILFIHSSREDIDMCNCVYVDDRPLNLLISNASKKILMLNKYRLYYRSEVCSLDLMLRHEDNLSIAKDFYDVVKYLGG